MDVESIMAGVELDLRAGLERYLPYWTVELGPIIVFEERGHELNELNADKMRAEIEMVLSWWLPPGTKFDLNVGIRDDRGNVITRRIVGQMPGPVPLDQVEVSFRVASEGA